MNATRWIFDAAVRALAVFALANLLLAHYSERWDANRIWIHAELLPGWAVQALVLLFALGVLFARRLHPAAAQATRGLALMLALACASDTIGYYRLLAGGGLRSSLPIPLSLPLALLLLGWALTARPARFLARGRTRRAMWIRVLDHSAPLWMVGVGVLAHILTFGTSDYARPADAAVVLGAAVRLDGRASQALRDRTLTACDLYHRGLVDTLVLSGGRDPRAPLSEPACMARIAVQQGVPRAALVWDEQGLTTQETLKTLGRLVGERGWQRVLVVSHDYHLARIALGARRAGLPVYTVPARESRVLLKKPYFVAREVLAWAWYYLRQPPDAASSRPQESGV